MYETPYCLLIVAICDSIDHHNENPLPYVGTAEAKTIIENVGRSGGQRINQQQDETRH